MYFVTDQQGFRDRFLLANVKRLVRTYDCTVGCVGRITGAETPGCKRTHIY